MSHNRAKFNFDRCDLDMGAQAVVPSTVTHDMLIGYASEMNRAPELDPAESIDRRLVFVYPKVNRRPGCAASQWRFPCPSSEVSATSGARQSAQR